MSAPDGGDRLAALTQRAGLRAATGIARQQGLPADDPRVLSSRGKAGLNLSLPAAPEQLACRIAGAMR